MKKKKEIVKQKLGQASCSKMSCKDCPFKDKYVCGFLRIFPYLKIKDAKTLITSIYESIEDLDLDLEKEVDTYAY